MKSSTLHQAKKNYHFSLKKLVIMMASLGWTPLTLANPVLDYIAAGQATIQQTINTTAVNQTSQQAIINWQSFNIKNNETTYFSQPAGGIALNRINPTQGASEIYGRLTATGQIILVNPAGIHFGPNAYVNVGGLVASTANITDQDFLNGIYRFSNTPGFNGAITNQGKLKAAQHGLIALIGNAVSNEGLIQVDLGHVVLASGKAFTMSFAGNDLINFSIDQETTQAPQDATGRTLKNGIVNTGAILADGSKILITAQAAAGVLDQIINLKGIIQARSVSQQNGEIIISGDATNGVVSINGKVDATGANQSTGGKIIVTGYNILLDALSNLNVSGDLGGGTINVGGDYQGSGTLPHANATVLAKGGILKADAYTTGNGGHIILWSDQATKAYGEISAKGGSINGNGGSVETSSHTNLDINRLTVNLLASNGNTGNWLLDPADLTICAACVTTNPISGNIFSPGAANSNLLVSDLTAALASANITVLTSSAGAGGNGDILINTNISYNSANSLTLSAYRNITGSGANSINNAGTGNIILRADNTGTGVGTVSFATGNVTTAGSVSAYYNPVTFGTQDPLYIGGSTPTQYMLVNTLGAEGDTSTRSLATIYNNSSLRGSNFALANNIDASATTTWHAGAGFYAIGGISDPFTGRFDGLNHIVNNLYINNTSGTPFYSGLFGHTSNATISNIGITNCNINTTGSFVGALIGYAVNSTISNAYSTGNVNGSTTSSLYVGGLVGQSLNSTISHSYSEANVIGTSNIGGLIGFSDSSTISNVYALGNVSSENFSGGLIGFLTNGTVTTAYAAGYVIGSSSSSAFTVNGLIGVRDTGLEGVVTGGIWNRETTGQSIGAFGSTAGISSLTSAGMMNPANYPATGFNFGTEWNIIPNQSYPYLSGFYSGTPQVISGTSPAAGGTLVNFINSGTLIGSTSAGANGFYYMLRGNHIYSGINDIIPDNSLLFAYTVGATKSNGISITPTGGGSLSGSNALNMLANTVTVSNSSGTAYSYTLLAAALDSLSTPQALYSLSGPNIILATNNGFSTSGSTAFSLLGDIIANGTGNIILSQISPLTNNVNLTTGTGNIAINGNINGAYNLTLTADGSKTLAALIGNVTPLTSLTLSGTGTNTLNANTINTTGAQTYSGTSTTLAMNAVLTGNNIHFNSDLLSNGLDLTLADSGISLFGGQVYTIGALTTNAININGDYVETDISQTYNGPVNVGADTYFYSGGSIQFASTLSGLAGTENISIDNQSNSSINGVASNIASLTKYNNGSLRLNAVNTYTGITTIDAGSIILGINNALPSTSSLVASGTLDLNGYSQMIASVTGNGTVTNSSGTAGTFTVNNSTADNFTGVLSGNLALAKSGSATLTLGNTNTYQGGTTVNAGTILLNATNALGSSNTLAVTGTLNLNGYSKSFSTVTGSGTVTNSSSTASILTINNTVTDNYAGLLTGNLALTKSGTGTLTLGGTNTYTGATNISAGTLVANNSSALGATTAQTIIGSSGTLNIGVAGVSEPITLNGGTLDGSSGASLTANVSLGTGLSSTINANAGTFTINGNINGAGNLSMQGAGTISVNGNIGNTTALTSLTSGNTNTILNGAIYTSGNQTYNTNINLTGNQTYQSSAGNITFNGTIDGANSLTVSSANTAFNGNLGSGTALTNLTATGPINFSGSTITTSGNQTYNGLLATTNSTTLTATGSNSTIAINNGLAGGQNITLTGGANNNENFLLSGNLNANNITINGSSGSNTLTVNSSGPNQIWNFASNQLTGTGITGSFIFNNMSNFIGGNNNDTFILSTSSPVLGTLNGGGGSNTIVGATGSNSWNISGVNAGNATNVTNGFTNIANLIGGTGNNTFTIQSGSINSITGGAGSNTLVANSTLANTWNISGTNAGSVNGVSSFNQIENLTGGNNGNNFIFANNAIITGTIDGGSLANTNTIDYSAYTSDINVNLGTGIFDGAAEANGTSIVYSYQNINNLIANGNNNNMLTLPNKMNTLMVTGSKAGFINDPLYFSGFSTLVASGTGNTANFNVPATIDYTNNTATINGVTMSFINFILGTPPTPPTPPIPLTPTTDIPNISGIIQSGQDMPGQIYMISSLLPNVTLVTQNIDQTSGNLMEWYDSQIVKVTTGVYCVTTNS